MALIVAQQVLKATGIHASRTTERSITLEGVSDAFVHALRGGPRRPATARPRPAAREVLGDADVEIVGERAGGDADVEIVEDRPAQRGFELLDDSPRHWPNP